MNATNDTGWFVYMIRCDDDSLYTGITTDMVRRWDEHQQSGGRCKNEDCEVLANLREVARKSSRGAKFFRTRKPLQLAYIESGHDRSSATRREVAIKRLSRAAKLQLLKTLDNELHSLDRALLPAQI